MAFRRPAIIVALALPLAIACGISATGQLEIDDAGSDPGKDATPIDGSVGDAGDPIDAGQETSPPCDSGLAQGAVLLPAEGGACPPGTTEKIVQTEPQALASACGCGTCVVSKEPSCAGNNFVWTWGSSSSCTSGPASYDVTADNACVQIFGSNTTLAAFNKWDRAPGGGACTAAGVATDAGVTSTAVRQCVPNPSECPSPSNDDRVCVPADPDGGACSGAFSVPLVVGDQATVSCAACGCTRTGQCHVEYHGNTTCTDLKYERNADGTCITTGTPSIQRIKVYPTALTCNLLPGAATPGLANQRTFCCKP